MIEPKDTITNSQYTYVKNPYYWDASAQHWDKVVIKIISDCNSILSALKTGQVQVAGDLERELAGRRDDQCLRLARRDQLVVVGVVRRDCALQHRDADKEQQGPADGTGDGP